MGNVWIRPWANFAHYMDPTFKNCHARGASPTEALSPYIAIMMMRGRSLSRLVIVYHNVSRRMSNLQCLLTDVISYMPSSEAANKVIIPAIFHMF